MHPMNHDATAPGAVPTMATWSFSIPRTHTPQLTILLLLCAVIAAIALTGAVYYFFESDSIHWVKEIHESLMLPLIILIVLHIAGVIKHELSTKEPLVSKMIHGDEVKC